MFLLTRVLVVHEEFKYRDFNQNRCLTRLSTQLLKEISNFLRYTLDILSPINWLFNHLRWQLTADHNE